MRRGRRSVPRPALVWLVALALAALLSATACASSTSPSGDAAAETGATVETGAAGATAERGATSATAETGAAGATAQAAATGATVETGTAAETGAAETAAVAGSWAATARRLTIPVFRPTTTPGLLLGFVNPILADPGCEPGREQLRALYFGAEAGRTLEIFEGYPRYCLDKPIEAPILRRVTIRGATATLFDVCAIRDCEPGFPARVLDWCEQGTSIQLLGVGISGDRLIAIARGMREARARPARRCATTTS